MCSHNVVLLCEFVSFTQTVSLPETWVSFIEEMHGIYGLKVLKSAIYVFTSKKENMELRIKTSRWLILTLLNSGTGQKQVKHVERVS